MGPAPVRMAPVRIALCGTGHGHAEGKLTALRTCADVELAGVYTGPEQRRAILDRSGSSYHGVRWFDHLEEILGDPTIAAVASEGRNDESLGQTAQLVGAGKHVWYDKPAGDDWAQWQAVVAEARSRGLLIQMGYMFRYHEGFRQISEWVGTETLGDVFSIRAHMSTSIDVAARRIIARQLLVSALQGHRVDELGDHVAGPVADHVGAEDLAVLGVGDQLHQPLAIVVDDHQLQVRGKPQLPPTELAQGAQRQGSGPGISSEHLSRESQARPQSNLGDVGEPNRRAVPVRVTPPQSRHTAVQDFAGRRPRRPVCRTNPSR